MPDGNVIRLQRLSNHDAERCIKEIASDSSRVFLTRHARDRMAERNITRQQVLECLSRFRIIEDPHRTVKGSWKMTIEAQSMDDFIKVALVIDNDNNTGNDAEDNFILVITVIGT